VLPREPICEADWSKFDTIELEKSTGAHNNKNYRFYFTKHGVAYREILIKESIDFSGIRCRTLVS